MGMIRNIVLLLTLLSAVLPSCKEGAQETAEIPDSADSVPTMATRNVMTLISDSGMTRYRITSRLWLVFDEIDTPVWRFPDGLFLEKFDEKFDVEATIRCDSATYFKMQKLWRLDGNVVIRNVKKELIETNRILWSQTQHKVYSDSFVHIEKSDRIIEGYGFRSNEKLTNYVILKPSGIFPIPVRKDSMPDGR